LDLDASTLEVIRTIGFHHMPPNVEGLTGITSIGGGYAVGTQGKGNSSIAFFDRQLALATVRRTSLVQRIHSLIENNGKLTVLSSGTDSIVQLAYGLSTSGEYYIENESAIWTLAQGRRTAHINSMVRSEDGSYVVSAFGAERVQDGDTSAASGFIMAITASEVLQRHIREPHSLLRCGGTMLYCESRTSLVRSLNGQMLDCGPGYPRGLAATARRLYLALSDERDVSVANSVELIGIHRRKSPMGARLKVYDWVAPELAKAKQLADVDLSEYAREVFELILPEDLY
jgi:hypothetical protein